MFSGWGRLQITETSESKTTKKSGQFNFQYNIIWNFMEVLLTLQTGPAIQNFAILNSELVTFILYNKYSIS